MRFTTKTEYGLVCLVSMAKQPLGMVFTVKDLVKSEQYSVPFTEKILQKLRTSRIVSSHQGKQGGYSLSRQPSQIKLKEIIEALRKFRVRISLKAPEQVLANAITRDRGKRFSIREDRRVALAGKQEMMSTFSPLV